MKASVWLLLSPQQAKASIMATSSRKRRAGLSNLRMRIMILILLWLYGCRLALFLGLPWTKGEAISQGQAKRREVPTLVWT